MLSAKPRPTPLPRTGPFRLGPAVHRRGSEVRIITRGGHDWTERFPAIAESAAELPAESFILDGEAVVLHDAGRADFGLIQQALGGRGGKRSAESAMLYAFDLLYLDGHDLTRMSLDERWQMLEFVLAPSDRAIRLSEEVEADGARFLAQACEIGVEGQHRQATRRALSNWSRWLAQDQMRAVGDLPDRWL